MDTLGLVLEVRVHPADVQDREGAKMVLEPLKKKHWRLKKIWPMRRIAVSYSNGFGSCDTGRAADAWRWRLSPKVLRASL